MTVFFFHRKPTPNRTFSIEILFNSIRAHLPAAIQYRVVVSTFINAGIFKKLYNTTEILFKKQGDVNHITGDIHYIALFMKKRRTILTIHDLNLLYSHSAIKRAIHRWFWIRLPVWRSKVVTVISQTTKEELLKYAKCPPDKIQIIHNCISSEFVPHPKPFNKQYPTILQIGTKPNKNLDRVIPALEGLPCQLNIVGQLTENHLSLLEKYSIDYHWQAGLTDEEVVQQYIDCDMLVFVSTLEGFGLPIVESQTVERPVVTSNLSAMPEVAGDAACLVDPYDVESIREGITRVIEDDHYRGQLLEKGRVNRARFTPEKIAAAYAQLYQEVYSGY